MAEVIFFGKPGCAGNRRQMTALREAGHTVVERDLLGEPWTAATLSPFLDGHSPRDWFNRSATRVKSGEVDPDGFDAERALAALLADHLLIRRPLLEVDGVRALGWDAERVRAWIGLTPDGEAVSERCAKGGEARPSCPPAEA